MRLTHGLGSPGTSLPCGQRPAASPELVLPAPGPAPHVRRPRGLPSGQRAPLAGSPRTPPHRARPPGPASPRLHAATTVTAPRVQVHVAEGESRPCHPPLGGVQAAPCAGRCGSCPSSVPSSRTAGRGHRALHGRVTVPVLLSRVLLSAEPPPVRAEASGRVAGTAPSPPPAPPSSAAGPATPPRPGCSVRLGRADACPSLRQPAQCVLCRRNAELLPGGGRRGFSRRASVQAAGSCRAVSGSELRA